MKIRFYLKWLVGIVFFLISIFGILENPFESLMFLTLALFIAPLTHYWIINRGLKVEISTKLKWIISIIIFMTIGFIGVNNKTEIIDEQGKAELSDKRGEVIERENEIETLMFYINNFTYQDDNGLRYNISIKKNIIKKDLVYKSPIVNIKEKVKRQISVYNITKEFLVYTNGNFIKKTVVEGFLFEDKDLGTEETLKICKDSIEILPELSNKVEILEKIELVSYVCAGFSSDLSIDYRGEDYQNFENLLTSYSNEAILASGVNKYLKH